ncbi:LuxR C-terminal-related transcriptional regulator, partial [Streptomyces sp. NPDC059468]|uniref:LuxR C-terminal-related transcriptional regulator n=1 Tax=Streptomyces sp. NPDC059468 TaxID=3346845 RepID=UPI00369B91C6
AVLSGAVGLMDSAGADLSAAGLRPRRLHSTETDTLTSRERVAATLTVHDRTEAEIATELHIDEQSVVRLLSAVYRKLGTDRSGLGAALGEGTAPG